MHGVRHSHHHPVHHLGTAISAVGPQHLACTHHRPLQPPAASHHPLAVLGVVWSLPAFLKHREGSLSLFLTAWLCLVGEPSFCHFAKPSRALCPFFWDCLSSPCGFVRLPCFKETNHHPQGRSVPWAVTSPLMVSGIIGLHRTTPSNFSLRASDFVLNVFFCLFKCPFKKASQTMKHPWVAKLYLLLS